MNKIDGFSTFTLFCLGILLIFVCIGILSLPLMFLWNWLMPYLFGLPTINILQAIGIGVLSNILFGNTTSLIKSASSSGKGHKKGNKKSLLFD